MPAVVDTAPPLRHDRRRSLARELDGGKHGGGLGGEYRELAALRVRALQHVEEVGIMTETIAAGSKRTVKHTCSACRRTVYVITLEDGSTTFADPELITVVPYETRGGTRKITARRSHAELCLTYQLKNERDKAKAAAAKRGARRP